MKGLGAGAGLISAGAVGTKALVGKAVAPATKVTAAATKVSALTTGLATKVFRNLHTMIVQTPSGGYPKQALSRTGDTILPSPAMADEVGNTLSARMGNDLLRPENRNILRFVNRIYDKSDYADIGYPTSLKARGWTDKSGTTDVEWKVLDDIEGYRAVDDLIGAEEKNLVRIGAENDLPLAASKIREARGFDDIAYADYHMTKNADLSEEIIRFEQSLSTIDTLAKNNPAKLISILDEMIEEAEGYINLVRRGVDDGTQAIVKPGHKLKNSETYYLASDKGSPVMINIGEQRSTIKMAQEMLEVLK